MFQFGVWNTGVVDQPQPAGPTLSTPFFHALKGGIDTHYYLWNGSGIELAQGGLSMWACVNLLAGCECIIFHNHSRLCDVPGKMRLLWLCRWSGASLVKMYSLDFFFFLWWETEGQRDKTERGAQRLVPLDLCVIKVVTAAIIHHNFWMSEYYILLYRLIAAVGFTCC